MRRKSGGLSLLFVIFVIAISFIAIVWFYEYATNFFTRFCKETQRKELSNKIWFELRRFESVNDTTSYNLVEDVRIEWCVEEFKYKEESGKKFISIKYKDSIDEIETNAVWLMSDGSFLTIDKPDVYDFKVSYRKVVLV